MKNEFTRTYQGQYHFRFGFELGQPMIGIDSGYPLVVFLYRRDFPEMIWEFDRILVPGQEVEFQLSYIDEVNIKGKFCIFHSYSTDEDFLFLDVWFGSQYEEHYEGNVLLLAYQPIPGPDPDPIIPDPIIPDPDPIMPDPDPVPDDEHILPAGYHDLFPFLHLRSWPELTAAQQQSFIEYSDNGSLPPAADLYAHLLKLTTRDAMEAEADLFINGGGGYAGFFIDDVGVLSFPFKCYPHVYNRLLERETLNFPEAHSATALLSSTDYATEINTIWQNVFALALINGYRVDLMEQLLKILIVDHVLKMLSASPPIADREDWRRLIHSRVLLPGALFPLPAPASPPLTQSFTGQVIPYAIGHLQKVQHCHTGYAPGEIAQIENVSIGEVKQVKHRKTLITEEKTDDRTEQQDHRQRHNTGSQLEQEATRALDQTTKDEWDFTNLLTSYGPPTTGTYNGKVNKTRDIHLNNDSANRFARKILATAVERVAQAVIHHRQTSVRQETEDMVVRTIDNRRGAQHIRSIYRWLNKIYQLRLVDYGQRFILELLIQHPDRPPLPAPAEPDTPLVPAGITPDNYVQLGLRYGITGLPLPPIATRMTSALLDETHFFPVSNLPVPEGYLPLSLTVTYNVPQTAQLIAGTKQAALSTTPGTVTIPDPMNIAGSSAAIDAVPVLLDLSAATQSSPPAPPAPFYCSIVMECTVSPATVANWQLTVYDRIEQTRHKKQHEEKKESQDPQIAERARRIWVTEAGKLVLYQIHRGLFPSPSSPPNESIFRPEYTQFIDEAFEWPEMSFALHDQHRQENMRILLPVNPGFAFRALYYLSTGIPWYGCERLTPVIDDPNLSNPLRVAAALQQAAGIGRQDKYEILLDTWQEAVPTSMQWLQDDHRLPGLNS